MSQKKCSSRSGLPFFKRNIFSETPCTSIILFFNTQFELFYLFHFVQDKIIVRTSHETWWFNISFYSKSPDKNYLYNSTVPSPFKVIRNFYGGRCLAFTVPDFLWNEGIRRIGIFLQKPSFIRSSYKKGIQNQSWDIFFYNVVLHNH